MEEDCQRALESSFTYGYGHCVFKHNIRGDQLEVLDCMPDYPSFLSPECLARLICPSILASSEDAAPGCIVEKWQRSLVEVPLLGI